MAQTANAVAAAAAAPMSLMRVLLDATSVRELDPPPTTPVSSAIILAWVYEQETTDVAAQGIALFSYMHQRGAACVADPELRAIAAATVAVKIAGNYRIVDILNREESLRPGFKRRLREAELAILGSTNV